ncbi:MAG: carbon-nitrogen hydrolase family protein, partial [Myxococcaceae bacterium]|nr:carbon-nitrogen hydrolase family protein [Myxococcaceae bacterium]
GLAAQQTANVIVTPESSAGLWQPAMERRWAAFAQKLEREQRSAIVGVTFLRSDGDQEAGAVLLGESAGPRTYRQRVPMPFAMWRPWSRAASFPANWSGRGTLRVRGRVIGVLICWEIGAPWAVIGSMLEGADSLVGLANTGWLRGTSAAQAERQALSTWGQLFHVPVRLASNE